MIIVNLEAIEQFALSHAEARKSLIAWRKITVEGDWRRKQDVLRSFPTAKMVAQNRARFEIVHNKYRLVAEVIYDAGIVEIRFIGTHAEYDRIDASII